MRPRLSNKNNKLSQASSGVNKQADRKSSLRSTITKLEGKLEANRGLSTRRAIHKALCQLRRELQSLEHQVGKRFSSSASRREGQRRTGTNERYAPAATPVVVSPPEWSKLNERRILLINKQVTSRITSAELRELNALNELADRRLSETERLPFDFFKDP